VNMSKVLQFKELLVTSGKIVIHCLLIGGGGKGGHKMDMKWD
jgi:hypothetical protein